MRSLLLLVSALLVFAAAAPPHARAQDKAQEEAAGAEETVRVRTRVVFLDALVRDKRTSGLASDLAAENFEVLADGRPREVSYFSREGDSARRPLALVLVLDLRRDGAGRYMRRTDILEAMAAEFARLPAQDEVAVLVLSPGGHGQKREWLARFTRNRGSIASALAVVPTLVAAGSPGSTADSDQDGDRERSITVNIGGDAKRAQKERDAARPEREAPATTAGKDKAAGAPAAKPPTDHDPEDGEDQDEKDIVSVKKVTGKEGDVVTTTVYAGGKVKTERTSKDGSVNVEIDDVEGLDFAGGVHDAVTLISGERPNSRGAIVWVADGISPVFYAAREATVDELTRASVTFSALVTDMKFGYKLFRPVLKPLGNMVGISIYGSAQHVARETGGEALRVNRPADYARGLNTIVGNLTGRYTLGFRLEEGEADDDRMHPLEVRVRARDAKGKERKLEVTSRRGFFMPKEGEAAQKRGQPSQ